MMTKAAFDALAWKRRFKASDNTYDGSKLYREFIDELIQRADDMQAAVAVYQAHGSKTDRDNLTADADRLRDLVILWRDKND